MSSDRSKRYAAGLPFAGERALLPAERAATLRLLRSTEWRSLGLATLFVAAFAIGATNLERAPADITAWAPGPVGVGLFFAGLVMAVVALVSRARRFQVPAALGVTYLLVVAGFGTLAPSPPLPARPLSLAVAVALSLLGFVFTAACAGQWRRILVRRSGILRDLATGQVERFARASDATPSQSGAGPQPSDKPVSHLPGGPHAIDLLGLSGLVLRVDGRILERPTILHVASVAPAAPHAYRVALPAGVAPANPGPRVRLRRRSLTAAEREELSVHIRRLRRRFWPAAAVMTALAAVLASKVFLAANANAPSAVTVVGWLLLTGLTCFAYARRVMAARRLERDRNLRWVVTVDDNDIDHALPPRLEVLPVSQLAWTENAQPASWRVSEL